MLKNIKRNTGIYSGLLIIGCVVFIASLVTNWIEEFWAGLALGFIIISGLRLIQILRVTQNERYAKQQQIKRSDERQIYISTQARAWTFLYSVMLAGLAVLVLYALNLDDIAQIVGTVMMLQVALYWGIYFIAARKF